MEYEEFPNYGHYHYGSPLVQREKMEFASSRKSAEEYEQSSQRPFLFLLIEMTIVQY